MVQVNSRTPSKCTKDLEAILFEPQSYAKEYMTKVAANLNLGKALLFTPQADSYIQTFEQEWGVTIEIFDAFDICTAVAPALICASTNAGDFQDLVSDIPVTDNFVISSLSINITGAAGAGGLGAYSLTSPASTVVQLCDNLCSIETPTSGFTVGFADEGASNFDCNQLLSNQILDPIQPLSAFNGESTATAGTWVLTMNAQVEAGALAATLTYCYVSSGPAPGSACSRGAMRAVTNVPGFTYNPYTQTVYCTEDIFDAFGNFKKVTISRSINGIYLK